MREVSLSLLLFGVLAAIATAMRATGWHMLAYGGTAMVLGGLLFSLPCALRYHLLLHRALAPRGQLARHWLRGPAGHHPRLRPEERRRVMPWFYAGAAGWTVAIVGCAFLGVAAFLGE